MTPLDPSTPSLPAYTRRVGGDLELRLKVVPCASRAAIAGPLGDRLKVRLAEPPEDGRANRALLASWLDGASVELVSGAASPLKTIRVHGRTHLSG